MNSPFSSSIVGVPGSWGVPLLSSPDMPALPTLNFLLGGAGAFLLFPGATESDVSLRPPMDVAEEADRGRVCAVADSETSMREDILTGSREEYIDVGSDALGNASATESSDNTEQVGSGRTFSAL